MKTKAPITAVSTVVMTDPEPPLSSTRAFVVQFRVGSGGQQQPFHGRVEHMTSGQTCRFHSAPELLAFFSQVLTTAKDHEG